MPPQLPAFLTEVKADTLAMEPVLTCTWKARPTRLYLSKAVKPMPFSALSTGSSLSLLMCAYWLITYLSCWLSKADCRALQILARAARLAALERLRLG